MAVAAPRIGSPALVHILPFDDTRQRSPAADADRFERARFERAHLRAQHALDEPALNDSPDTADIPVVPADLRALYRRQEEEGGFGGEEGGGGGSEEGGEEGGSVGGEEGGGVHGSGGDEGEGEGDGEGEGGVHGGGEDEPEPVDGPDGESEGGSSVFDDGCEGKCSPADDDDEGTTSLGTGTSSTPWIYYPYPPLFWGWHDHPQPTVAPNASTAGNKVGETAFVDGGNNGTQEYAIYGDGRSLDHVWPKIQAECNAQSVAAWEMIPNNTLQSYRNGTFAFLRENGTAPAINGSFEACVNNTIGHNLPLRGAAAGFGMHPAAFALPALAMLMIFRG